MTSVITSKLKSRISKVS